MNRIIIVTSAVHLLISIIFAQEPDTLWTRTIGGVNDDIGRSVQQTYDGGYIITGYTGSIAGGFNVYLVKTDSLGSIIWTKTFGGKNSDTGSSISQCSDSGYIITGNTRSFGAGENDVYLIKTNALGDTIWTRTYGGYNEDGGSSIQQTFDGGFIIVGETMSFGYGDYDVYLIKTDSLGDTIWTKTYGGKDCDGGQSVKQTTDGGYIIVGDTKSFGTGWHDVYLIKTDARGETLWTKTYGGLDFDYGESVQQTTDKGYIIVGWTRSFGNGLSDIYLIKTDKNGDALWTRTYGGKNHDFGFSVHETLDGGYIITGDTKSFGSGWYDVYIIKTDENGDTLWTKTFGGTQPDEGFSIERSRDGGYIIAGSTKSFGSWDNDVYLIKLKPIEPPASVLDILIWDTLK